MFIAASKRFKSQFGFPHMEREREEFALAERGLHHSSDKEQGDF